VRNATKPKATSLREVRPTLVVLEATGGLEQPVAVALAVVGVPVAVVNLRQVRDFAKAVGTLAKSYTLDAQDYEGGKQDWMEAGLPVESEDY
jgi:transposase